MRGLLEMLTTREVAQVVAQAAVTVAVFVGTVLALMAPVITSL